MSNHLAIATITATLQRALQAAIQSDVDGARTTTLRPSDIGSGTPETGVNVFLYQVITNPALHNIDATPLRSRGTPVKRQAALDLYYMLSFYGNDNELAPQRLLGSTVRTLNDRRVITPDMIRETCEDSTLTFLRDSNLAEQVQQIGIMPLDLNLEDLSKTWSVFFQTPYVLSVAYKVLVVLLEGEEPFKRSLPVRDRQLGNAVAPLLSRPTIAQVRSQAGQFSPILASSTLLIQGKHLKGDRFTQVRIGTVDVTPPDISADQILLPLVNVPPSALRPGMQSLQVLHPPYLTAATQPTPPHGYGSESNAAPFVLCPTLTSLRIDHLSGSEDEPRSGRLMLESDLIIGPRQRVSLALNEWSAQSPASYLFEADSRAGNTRQITVTIQGVKPGDYLARLVVDGAESQLDTDSDPESPTFQWYIAPKILIV